MFLQREEFREGIGPAIVRAKDMLMFIPRFGELSSILYLCFLACASYAITQIVRDDAATEKVIDSQKLADTRRGERMANAF